MLVHFKPFCNNTFLREEGPLDLHWTSWLWVCMAAKSYGRTICLPRCIWRRPPRLSQLANVGHILHLLCHKLSFTWFSRVGCNSHYLDQCQVSSRPGVALICLFTISVEMSWNWIEWGGWLPLNLNICFWVNLHYELRAVFTKPLIFFCNPPLSSSWWATHHSNVPVTCNTGPLYHWTTVPL